MLRRRVLRYAAATSAALHLDGFALWAQTADFPGPHPPTLRALAGVLLPASQGSEFLDRQTELFVRWVKGYRANAEMEHGYGFTRIQNTPAHPAPRYGQQLNQLDSVAQKQHGSPFAQMPAIEQRTLVEATLAEAKITALPPYPGGSHVVADFLAFYFRSSEANDLCFQAQIGRQACNGFAGVEQPPSRLKRRSA
ncbi:MAG: gluconate 2-dehydrogenase subunit 3 family protein [Bryobacteraceae bacterium]|nr:gluconate 2-dehydrogenase subunit 3 family protein [Bryobacteraceae bacterium]